MKKGGRAHTRKKGSGAVGKGKIRRNSSKSPSLSTPVANSATGIREFDAILQGGFPKGTIVYLNGTAGTGKTIFSFQWLFEGAKQGEHTIYITLTEPLFKVLSHLESMSFFQRELIEQEKVQLVDLRTIDQGAVNEKSILHYIEQLVVKSQAKRLCIDSITAIAYALKDTAAIRHFIFELGKLLAELGCTVILTGETRSGSALEVEQFISDAVITLSQHKIRGKYQRVMDILKVRGRNYRSEEMFFKITPHGIEVFPKVRPGLSYESSFERVGSGITVFDRMLCGGLYKNSSTLIAGSSGTGKSTFSLQFLLDGLKRGESCLYAGFEESSNQLLRNAKSYGIDFDRYIKKGQLTTRCMSPSNEFIEEHFIDIKRIIEAKGVQRCVIDSLSAISNAFPPDLFLSFVHRLHWYFKSKNVTAYFTTETDSSISESRALQHRFSTMTDNVVVLRQVEIKGALTNVLKVLKLRASDHDRSLRMYTITPRGVSIGRRIGSLLYKDLQKR